MSPEQNENSIPEKKVPGDKIVKMVEGDHDVLLSLSSEDFSRLEEMKKGWESLDNMNDFVRAGAVVPFATEMESGEGVSID